MSDDIRAAAKHYDIDNTEPINWDKDTDEILCSKINARISDAKPLHEKISKDCKIADAYLDGDLTKLGNGQKKAIYNPTFPIVRNLTGLVTDAKPNPSVRLVNLDEEIQDSVREEMLKTASNLGASLEDWWDDIRGQSKLQRCVFGAWTYADYYIMPYWDTKIGDVNIEMFKPTRVTLDPNAESIESADYAIIDFYRTKQWMLSKYKDKASAVKYSDYKELRLSDDMEGDKSTEMLKNVCNVKLYMERDYWVYKADNEILEKIPNPFWVLEEEKQKKEVRDRISKKYQKNGVAGVAAKAIDAVKGVVGMETNDDKIDTEFESAMMSFTPKKNYLKYPVIPIIQFDTYRMGGELYSRSVLKQTIEGVDEINRRKYDIQENSESVAKPTTYVDGKIYNEDQAKRIQEGKLKGEIVRVNTGDNKSISSSVFVSQGTPLPSQFFDSIEITKREIDNIWGHHEVSRGGSDPTNKTKGGILALQEADQTPIRYVTRNIEDALQDMFALVVQIRKIYKPGKYALERGGVIDYDQVDQHYKVYLKSGSMMPISKEAQRAEAQELWNSGAIDPLTLHERLNDSEPEKTAKRLEVWKNQKIIMGEKNDDQQMKVLEKIKMIQAGQFDQVQISPEDDPKTHYDMLLLTLQSNKFTPEQEAFIATLIKKYEQMAGGAPGQQASPPVTEQPPVAPPTAPPPMEMPQ